jgi:hypothetical protein
MVAAQQNSIWEKHRTPDSFRSKGICRRKESSRRRLGWPHHILARPGLGRATRWCGGLPAPLRLVFWLRGSSRKIGFLQYFPRFFLKIGFLHKNKTPGAVTQHTTACCSMQVIDITLVEQPSTNITSLRMVQQKHCGSKYKPNFIILQTKA